MPLNLYVRPDLVQTEMQQSSSASITDANLAVLIERVCRALDHFVGERYFYSETRTVEFDGQGGTRLRLSDCATEPGADWLISITTLKVDTTGDGTFDKTLTSGADYWLEPANPATTNKPARVLVIPTFRSTSPAISEWPTEPRRVQIVGKFGWSEETEAAGALDGAISDTTATSITYDSGDSIAVGDTIIVNSEHMYVSAIPTSTTATVVRGVNGTTAATHSNNDTFTRRVFPRDIVDVVLKETSRGARWIATGSGGLVDGLGAGGVSSFRPDFAQIAEERAPFKKVVFA